MACQIEKLIQFQLTSCNNSVSPYIFVLLMIGSHDCEVWLNKWHPKQTTNHAQTRILKTAPKYHLTAIDLKTISQLRNKSENYYLANNSCLILNTTFSDDKPIVFSTIYLYWKKLLSYNTHLIIDNFHFFVSLVAMSI